MTSTQRVAKSAIGRDRGSDRPGTSGAFTLIELLLVISIIALLVTMLLPAIGSIRGTAKTIQCGNNVRQICQAQAGYATEYRDAIAGSPATSGFDCLPAQGGAMPPVPNKEQHVGATWKQWSGYLKSTGARFNGITVQTFDFIGPLAYVTGYTGPGPGLDATQLNDKVRADRMKWYRDNLPWAQCPSNAITAVAYTGDGDSTSKLVGDGRMLSYNMSTQITTTENTSPYGSGDRYSTGIDRRMYKPSLSLAANSPSGKALVFEGHRFANFSSQPDFTFKIDAAFGGAFGGTGPWWATGDPDRCSQELNRFAAPGEAGNVVANTLPDKKFDARRWAFRHGTKRRGGELTGAQYVGNVGFFDGHVVSMQDGEATNPDLWFPGGTRLWGSVETWEYTKKTWPAKVTGNSEASPYIVP